MTPKEKALELYCVYEKLGRDFTRGVSIKDLAKESAIVCCNEVLGYMGADRGYEFWTSVKEELQKL